MSSIALTQTLTWIEPRYTSRAMNQAFVGLQDGKDRWECSVPAEFWLAALWEAGEGTGTVSPFTSCAMAAVAGLAKSEPSQYLQE